MGVSIASPASQPLALGAQFIFRLQMQIAVRRDTDLSCLKCKFIRKSDVLDTTSRCLYDVTNNYALSVLAFSLYLFPHVSRSPRTPF